MKKKWSLLKTTFGKMNFLELVILLKVLFFKISNNLITMKAQLFQHQIISALSFLYFIFFIV